MATMLQCGGMKNEDVLADDITISDESDDGQYDNEGRQWANRFFHSLVRAA